MLLGFKRRGAADDGQVDGAELLHGLQAALVQTAFANDGAHSVLLDQRRGKAIHARAGGGADADFLPLVAHLAKTRRSVDAGCAGQTDGRLVVLVEHIDLSEVADSEQQPVEVNDVSARAVAGSRLQ